MADEKSIVHDWQLNPIPPAIPVADIQWHGPENLAGDTLGEIVAARNADGHIEIVYTDARDIIFHNWQLVPNGNWASYPGDLLSTFPSPTVFALQALTLALALDATGCLQLFFAGEEFHMYRIKQSKSNNGWDPVVPFGGGIKARHIAVGMNQNGTLEIFYVGKNNHIYHNREAAPGSGVWEREVEFGGGVLAKQIAVGRNQNYCLEIFHTGMGDHIYHNRQHSPNDAEWEGAFALGGEATQLVVAQNIDQTFELFYTGEGNGLYHNRQSAPNMGAWGGQTPFGAEVGSKAKNFAYGLSVARNKDGRLEMFYVGTNSHIYHNWQISPGSVNWNGETRFNYPATASNIVVIPNEDGRLEVSYFDVNKEVLPPPDPGSDPSESEA